MSRIVFMLGLLVLAGCKTEVNAPGVKVNVGPGGVKVTAPGANVDVGPGGAKVDIDPKKKD